MKKQLLVKKAHYSKELDMHLHNDDMQIILTNMEEGLERTLKVIHNIAISAHMDGSKKQFADLNTCIRSSYKTLLKQVIGTAKIELSLTELPSVCINSDKITQILSNLIINASESMQAYGLIHVSSSVQGDKVSVSVKDNGCGIAQNQQSKIFDPFYTSKKQAESTGLGLAIAYDIAHEHGGGLQVISDQGLGTEFILTLPIAKNVMH